MSASRLGIVAALLSAAWGGGTVPATAQPLTADRAVRMALQRSVDVARSRAGVIDSRAGLYSAYNSVLPTLSASLGRSEQATEGEDGFVQVADELIPVKRDNSFVSRSKTVGVDWTLFSLSAISGLRSSRSGFRSTQLSHESTRQAVAYDTRSRFYNVVKAIKLAEVSEGALKLSRDDERRVRALFEVGSVSKSDLLKAQVRTAQSELDSLSKRQAMTTQRIALAQVLGVREDDLGEVDTLLATDLKDYDEATVLAEAERSRPDLKSAALELSAARSQLTASHLSRLPSVVGSASMSFQPKTEITQKVAGVESSEESRSERDWSTRLALQWRYGLSTEATVATARARVLRAEESAAALRRELGGEVRQALFGYREAAERARVARRALESADENLKLSQEKYNVGSATILELIDAQVQLQQAKSDLVAALADIQVADARLQQVRGVQP